MHRLRDNNTKIIYYCRSKYDICVQRFRFCIFYGKADIIRIFEKKASSSKARFTEYCFIACLNYEILGLSVLNIQPKLKNGAVTVLFLPDYINNNTFLKITKFPVFIQAR